MRRSILTEKVARRGHHLAREYHVDPFALSRVRDVMATDVETMPDNTTLHQLAAFLTNPETRHPSFPVVDAERRVLGIVDPPTVLRWRRAGRHRLSTARELLANAQVTVAFPDEYLDGLVDRMMSANVAHLPVISREDARLVGYISWKDLLRVRTRLQAEERQRVVFYRVR
jgi:chloride channel protein, CIC family